MKIERVENRILKLPYKKPLITSTNKFEVAQGLLLRIVSDQGMEGYGYVELFPRSGETLGSASYAMDEVLKPVLLGRDPRELGRIMQRVNHVLVRNHRVKSGVETALYDLLAKSAGCPLYVLLGGLIRREITVIRMMSLADPEAMAEEAKSLVSEGIKALKLKINGNLKLDYKRVESVRKAAGDGVFLKVDANEAYDAKSAVRMAQKLADLGVEIFEQPVPRNQIENLIDVKKHSPIKIEADQSVSTALDAYRLIREGGIDAVNTSPLKAGGISEVRKIAGLCEIGGIQCALSNTAGSMAGDAAALHLAASLPSVSPYCEIGEFELISGDPFEGLRVEDGILKVHDAPGLGVKLSDAK